MIEDQKNSNLKYYAIITGFALLVMLPIFYQGVPLGNDLPQHYQFASTIKDSVQTGEIYPSFDANMNQGFADYGIRFYPPATYYLLSVNYLIFGNWYLASLVSFFLIFWISGIGTFLWAKENFSAEQSVIAAGIFIFAPYHINQIYNNFLLAEFASTAVLPFCFLFIARVCQRCKFQDVIGLSISYAILVLTHLPLTIIGSIALAVYGLTLLRKENLFKQLINLSLGALLGIGASSFYWIKILTEKDWLNHSGEKYSSAIYSYLENFLFRPQNILNFYTDVTCMWLGEIMLASMLFIILPTIYFLIKEKFKTSRFNISLTILLTFSLFMLSPLSMFIWSNLEFLQKVQFPWRWMGIVSLSGSLLASVGITRVSETLKNNNNVFLQIGIVIILVLFSFTSILIVKQAGYNPQARFNESLRQIQTQNSFECWWTIWAKQNALTQKDKVETENREVKIVRWDKYVREFEVENGETQTAKITTFYYPHWQVKINETTQKVENSANGTILINIPSEKVKVLLTFEEPFAVKIAQIISAFSWLILLIIGVILRFNLKSFFNKNYELHS